MQFDDREVFEITSALHQNRFVYFLVNYEMVVTA